MFTGSAHQGSALLSLLHSAESSASTLGENQAQIVLGVLEELEIRVQIGCLVGDDAAPNDTAVSAIWKFYIRRSPKTAIRRSDSVLRPYCQSLCTCTDFWKR